MFLWLLTPFVADTKQQDKPHPSTTIVTEDGATLCRCDPETPPQITPNGPKVTPPKTLLLGNRESSSPKVSHLKPASPFTQTRTALHSSTSPQDHTPSSVVQLRTSANHTPSETEDAGIQRSRSSAFVDENTAAGIQYVITPDRELIDTSRKARKKSLCVSTPWAVCPPGLGGEDVERTVDIIAQTFRHILWNSTIDQTPWRVSVCIF